MKSFLWKISLYRFLDAFKLIGVIYTLFLQFKGLNVFQIALLIGIWSVTQLVLEVPMGLIADRFPRRNLLIISMLAVCIGFSLWIKGGFLFYAFGMILWGVKNSLTSGTFESFVYDELKSQGLEQNYGKISSRIEGFFQFGLMLSAIIGGLLAKYSFNLVLISSIFISLLAALVLFTIETAPPIKQIGKPKYLEILKNAIREIRSNYSLLMIILFISLTFGVSASAGEYWPLILNKLVANTAIVGLLMAIEFGIFSLSGYSFHYWDKLKLKGWNQILFIISGALLIIFGFGRSVVLIPLVFISSYFLKLALIKSETDLQHAVSSNQRATVLSVKALILEAVYLLSLLSFGYISTKLGIISIIYVWGALVVLWVFFIGNKLRNG